MVSNDRYCSQPTAVLVSKYTLTSLMRTGELTTCVLSQLAPKHQFRVGASISMYAGYTLIFASISTLHGLIAALPTSSIVT